MALEIFLIILLFFSYMFFEASWLKVNHHLISKKNGLRIAIVSDLHPAFCRVSPLGVRKIILSLKPDLYIFLGDALDKPKHIKQTAKWLKTCSAGTNSVAILGNHDRKLFIAKPHLYKQYKKELLDAGIKLCKDGHQLLHFGERKLLLTAFNDKSKSEAIRLPETTGDHSDTEIFHIVCTHNPQLLTRLPEKYADFAVAGHFHGGQIWMPFNLEFRLFRGEALGKAGIVKGLHTINGTPTWISCGIGNVMFPLRLGARPEITFIDI